MGRTCWAKLWVLPLLFVLGLLCGCAPGGRAVRPLLAVDLPSRAHIADVPFFPQKAYQCGPAALAMTLGWSGLAVSADDLVAQVYLPDRQGSLQSSLIAAVRRRGRVAYPIHGLEGLLTQIAAGHPVIVLQNLGIAAIPRWHYAVVTGYDMERGEISMHSGINADRRIGLRTFEHTWRRADEWGLLVLPPERLPACVDEQSYLKAILGVQQAGAIRTAVTAFETAAGRWPDSAATHMSLGNARYALGDLEGAAQAFRQAVAVDPHNGAGFNNLAHVLARSGKWAEAEQAARRAVELGGPQQELFRRTLDEVVRRAS